MATLAEQLATTITLTQPDHTLRQWTNRGSTDTSLPVNTAVLTAVCGLVAADIQSILGDDIDGTDTQAVSIGVDMLVARFMGTQAPVYEEGQTTPYERGKEQLRELARSRRLRQHPNAIRVDNTVRNEQYPGGELPNVP